jgi:hypothetical protein
MVRTSDFTEDTQRTPINQRIAGVESHTFSFRPAREQLLRRRASVRPRTDTAHLSLRESLVYFLLFLRCRC